MMVTHDLDSLHRVCDRIAVLGDGKIIAAGTMDKMLKSEASLADVVFPWRPGARRLARAGQRVAHDRRRVGNRFSAKMMRNVKAE